MIRRFLRWLWGPPAPPALHLRAWNGPIAFYVAGDGTSTEHDDGTVTHYGGGDVAIRMRDGEVVVFRDCPVGANLLVMGTLVPEQTTAAGVVTLR